MLNNISNLSLPSVLLVAVTGTTIKNHTHAYVTDKVYNIKLHLVHCS